MQKIGFDSAKYFKMQSEKIKERINDFGGKLYLEFGGKLFDDFHASRVLPGFAYDSKVKLLCEMKDQAEIIIVIIKTTSFYISNHTTDFLFFNMSVYFKRKMCRLKKPSLGGRWIFRQSRKKRMRGKFLAIKKDGIAVLFYCGCLFICKPCCQLRHEVLR